MLGNGNDGNGESVGVSDGGGGGGVSVGVSDGGGGGGVSVGVSDGGGGGGVSVGVSDGGGGGGLVCVGPGGGGGGVVCGVVGATDCDFVGVGVGLGFGVGLVVNAGPMNGILVSESLGLALFEDFTEGLALADVPAGCDDERPAVLRAAAVDPAVVRDGIGAGDGLSKLNCGSAPPL